jgi:hypothetical protein
VGWEAIDEAVGESDPGPGREPAADDPWCCSDAEGLAMVEDTVLAPGVALDRPIN